MIYEVPTKINASSDNETKVEPDWFRVRKIVGSRERILEWLKSQGEFDAIKEILARKEKQL